MGKIVKPTGNDKKKILIVDDDETHLFICETALGKKYAVITAKSGKEALELFYNGLVPNLILLDIIMPDMDGWDAFRRLKAISVLHNVPVAFFTSSGNAGDRNHAVEMGAVDYIKKPIDADDLLNRIEKIWEKQQ